MTAKFAGWPPKLVDIGGSEVEAAGAVAEEGAGPRIARLRGALADEALTTFGERGDREVVTGLCDALLVRVANAMVRAATALGFQEHSVA